MSLGDIWLMQIYWCYCL